MRVVETWLVKFLLLSSGFHQHCDLPKDFWYEYHKDSFPAFLSPGPESEPSQAFRQS